jgi:hypothetical protein
MNISEKNQKNAYQSRNTGIDSRGNNIAHNLTINVTENWAEGDAINFLLRDHEEAVGDWQYQALVRELYRWVGIFQSEFKLELAHPVVGFDRLRCTTLACYEQGRSRIGTKYTIIINSLYLNDPFHCVLRRLLHELIHLWQELYGKPAKKPPYHNKQFIDKALTCGLLTDHKGYDLGHTKIFSDVLAKYGVNAPEIEEKPQAEQAHGTSKIKKWSCGCTNVWCAVELRAQCLECGNGFVQVKK